MSLYDKLGVSKDSSKQDITKAFRKLAVEHHPDKGGNEETFKDISHAYEILTDEDTSIKLLTQNLVTPAYLFTITFNNDKFSKYFKKLPGSNIPSVLLLKLMAYEFSSYLHCDLFLKRTFVGSQSS
jgi:hypothetical protein